MVAVSVGAWALRVAVVAGLTAVVGARSHRFGHAALRISAAALAVALVALAEAFWSNDYSLVYVADHARREVGTATRLSGMWGGMAGSLLVFAFGTAVASVIAAWRAPPQSRGLLGAVGGAYTASLSGIVVAFSNPFDRLEVPAVDGAGLTPILEHPAMLYHPLLVYAGLTSLTAAFALTIVGLERGHLDEEWRAQVRRWLLVPWTLLGVGMLAGAHWAYVELGWGGYWAWDPVENTALLPWLAVTVALHQLQLSTSSDAAPSAEWRDAWPVLGAMLLALFGGLMTRSGATMSVHAFAEARSIGRALAVLLIGTTLGCAVLLMRHRRTHLADVARAALWPPSRTGALRLQKTILLTALLVVLLGSAWPLTADLRDARALSVDGSFFAAFCAPLAVVLLVTMAVGPALGRLPVGQIALTTTLGAAAGVGLAALDGWHGLFALAVAASGGAATAGTVVNAARGSGRGRGGSHLAHLGMAVFLLGVAGTTTGATETISLARGQTTLVQGHAVTNLGVAVLPTSREGTEVVEATIDVDGRTYQPQLIAHTTRARLLAESALHSSWHRDVQVMLRDAGNDGSVVLQVGIHPLQQLVWWGGLLVVAGGVIAFATAPTRTRDPGHHRRRGDDAASRAATPVPPQVADPAPAPPLAARDASDPFAQA